MDPLRIFTAPVKKGSWNRRCAARGCKSTSSNNYLTFHLIPRPNRRLVVIEDDSGNQIKVDQHEAWMRVLKIGNSDHELKVCSLHFTKDDYSSAGVPANIRRLKSLVVPTCNLPLDEADFNGSESAKERKENRENRGKGNQTQEENNIQVRGDIMLHKPCYFIIKNESAKPTGSIVVKSDGLVTQPSLIKKTTNLQSSPMIISMNSNILKSQIKAASSQTPIIIPAQNLPAMVVNKPKALPPKTVHSETVMPVNAFDVWKNITVGAKPQLKIKNVSNEGKLKTIPKDILDSLANIGSKLAPSVTKAEKISRKPTPGVTNVVKVKPKIKKTIIIQSKTSNVGKNVYEQHIREMNKILSNQLMQNNALRRKLRICMRKQSKAPFLKDVFTDDQVRALQLKCQSKSVTWSHKTMMKALKLKQKCGVVGYVELLKQNMPLPSIKILNQWRKFLQC